MTLEALALDFAHQLQDIYFSTGDLQSLLSALEVETSFIGTGRDELCCNIEEIAQKLQGELQELSGCFTIQHDEYHAVPLSDVLCLVFGELHATSEHQAVADLHCRISLICRLDGDGMKLIHLHMSNPDRAQALGSSYASRVLAQERELLQDQITTAMRNLQTLAENIPGGVQCCLADERMTIVSISDGFYPLFGYSEEEIRTQFEGSYLSMIYPEDRTRVQASMGKQLAAGNTVELEYRVQRKNGSILWIMDRGKMVPHHGDIDHFYSVLLDITTQKRKSEMLRLTLERHQVIMNQGTDIIFEWDITKDTIVYSNNWNKRFGYSPVTRKASKAIASSGNIHEEDLGSYHRLVQETAAGSPCSEAELRILDALGSYVWCRIRTTTQFNDDGVPVSAVGVIVDIDADKKQRQELIDQAERDSLTWLLNKVATKNYINKLLAEPDARPGTLFIIDLDDFKGVNDTFGHLCGDAVLVDVSSALQRIFRAKDIVGRIGGDEFMIFMPGLVAPQANERVHLLLDTLSRIQIGDSGQTISACVGISFFPDDATDFYSLYNLADCALYQAKHIDQGSYCYYDHSHCAESPSTSTPYSGTAIDSDSSLVREQMAQYAFRVLYSAKNIPQAIQQMLEVIGHSYDLSRIYIAEDTPDGSARKISFLWCSGDCTDSRASHSYTQELSGIMDCYDEQGLFYCRHVATLPEGLRAFYGSTGTYSLFQVAILDEGVFHGAVCFEECRTARELTPEQLDSLSLVSKMLATTLLKHRYKEQLL